MKKFVSSVSNLFDRCGGKRLSQLVALFVAIALTPSMLLAEDEDDINGRDKVHDPTGAWLITNSEGLFILTVFHKGGTLTGDLQGESAFVPGGHGRTRAWMRVSRTASIAATTAGDPSGRIQTRQTANL